MNMRLQWLMGVLVMIATAAPAWSQDGAKPPPSTKGGTQGGNTEADERAAAESWRNAMEALDYPVIVFGGGVADSEDGGGFAQGLRDQAMDHVEAMTTWLSAAMSRADPDTDVIDVEGVEERMQREADSLGQSGASFEDIDAYLSGSEADYAIVLELTPLVPREWQIGASLRYRVLGKIGDRRGRRMDINPHEMTLRGGAVLDAHSARIFKNIATAMAGIANRPATPLPVSIKADQGRGGSTLTPRQVRDMADAIEDLDGVQSKKVRLRKSGDWYSGTVRYEGDELDLAVELEELFERELGIRCTAHSANGGVVITTYGEIGLPLWRVLGDPKAPDGKRVRDAFRERYDAAGRPQVAVCLAEFSAIGAEEAALDAGGRSAEGDALELAVEQVLLEAGIDVKGGQAMRAEVRRQLRAAGGEAEGGEPSEADVDSAMRDLNGVDMYVIGRFERGALGGAVGGRMTFRAKSRQADRLLGVGSWPARDAIDDPQFGVDEDDLADIARYVGGRILEIYYKQHLIPGSTIDVAVKGLGSFRQVQQITDAIEEVVSNVVAATNPQFNRGEGTFTVRYQDSFEECQRGIQEVLGSFSFDVATDEATQDRLRLSVRPSE